LGGAQGQLPEKGNKSENYRTVVLKQKEKKVVANLYPKQKKKEVVKRDIGKDLRR